jgi:hypothetical protein
MTTCGNTAHGVALMIVTPLDTQVIVRCVIMQARGKSGSDEMRCEMLRTSVHHNASRLQPAGEFQQGWLELFWHKKQLRPKRHKTSRAVWDYPIQLNTNIAWKLLFRSAAFILPAQQLANRWHGSRSSVCDCMYPKLVFFNTLKELDLSENTFDMYKQSCIYKLFGDYAILA